MNKDNEWAKFLRTGKTGVAPAIKQPAPKPRIFSPLQRRAINISGRE